MNGSDLPSAKRPTYILLAMAMVMTTTACEDPALRLSKWTDVKTIGMSAKVSLIDNSDLDQPGYRIVVPKDRDSDFQHAIENAAGKRCLQLVLNGSGCAYKSKAGHYVFIEHKSVDYEIYTSG
jgi:hypothetical protein